MEVILSAALLVIGLVMLCFGGNWLVSGGVGIAKKLRISNLVIGLTIVAYGTSTPELAASIAAAGDHGAIILGNIVVALSSKFFPVIQKIESFFVAQKYLD